VTRKPRRRDPLEATIEVALQPGRFIAYGAGRDFVASLEGVAGQLEKLVRADPERAVTLYETFLAGCYEKADELDDSSGRFGMFVDRLFSGWVKVRQAAAPIPTRPRAASSPGWTATGTASATSSSATS